MVTVMTPEDLRARRVVLFDFDGTVADTARAVITSTEKTLKDHGFTREEMGDLRRMIGPPLRDSFHDFYGFSREDSEIVADEYRAYFNTLPASEYPAFPGIPELLDALSARGRTLAVATSRMEDKALLMIGELGLTQFSAICGMNPEEGRLTKTDSIRDALAKLGAKPDEAVMVGDRKHDVLGAHAYGVPCIGIYSGGAISGEHEEAGADAIVHSVAELSDLLLG